MNGISSLIRRVQALAFRAIGHTPAPSLDEAGRHFVEFCRRRWPTQSTDGPLVLVHQSEWYPLILAYAFMTHALARREKASLASFGFRSSGRPLNALFAGFGAPNILGPRELRRAAPAAKKLADEIWATLKTPRDVANLCVDGISLGDVIYDTHLRYHCCETVEIGDPRLRETLQQAMERYVACRELLDTRRIAVLLVDHAVYMDAGILARLAVHRGITVYQMAYKPISLLRLDPTTFPHYEAGPGTPPAGTRTCKLPLPYHRFAQIFAGFPAEQHEARRAQGRERLEHRLAGKFDFRVLQGGSAYRPSDGPRVLAAGDRPRMLVMLHDFCDAPHAYRDLIFEDHYRWACWLFERAKDTPFDWYAKPHPNSAHDPAKARLNNRVVAEMKERYPHIHFLAPEVSNRQLMGEGLTALFTGYGTVGHEFAYVGVPVVNAGDNPHINYGFNFNPQTVAEFSALVDQAANLPAKINRSEIEEYAYLRYVYFYDRTFHTVEVIPPGLEENPETFRRATSSEALRLVSESTDEREAQFDEYLERFFASGRHELPA